MQARACEAGQVASARELSSRAASVPTLRLRRAGERCVPSSVLRKLGCSGSVASPASGKLPRPCRAAETLLLQQGMCVLYRAGASTCSALCLWLLFYYLLQPMDALQRVA